MKVNNYTKSLITDYVKNAIHPYESTYGNLDMSINAAVKAIIIAIEMQGEPNVKDHRRK